MTDLQRELILELRRGTCHCGRVKREKQTFCGGCYRRLPSLLRTQLYSRIGEGYEEAHARSIKHLGFNSEAKQASLPLKFDQAADTAD